MALGDDVPAKFQPRSIVYPASIKTGWQTVIDAGGMDDADADPITDPATDIDGTDHHDLTGFEGTTLKVRMAYDDGVSGTITSPIIQVFGRYEDPDGSNAGDWMELENGSGDIEVTLTVDTTNDASDGTLNFTRVRANTHSFDVQGCARIRIGVNTAFAATGTVTTAYLEAKVI